MKHIRNQATAILDAARDCIAERGYANVSTRDVAQRAGVALSQLTYHYHSKENLFCAVIRSMIQQLLDDLDARIAPDASEQANLNAFVGYFERLCTREPARMRLFVDFVGQSLWTPAFQSQLKCFFEQLRQRVRSFLPGANRADFPHYLVGALYGVATQSLFDDEESAAGDVFRIVEGLAH